MQHIQEAYVTAADDEVFAQMGGTSGLIPLITLRSRDGEYGPRCEIVVNPTLLTRAEQAAWLDRLAAAASELAKAVRALP